MYRETVSRNIKAVQKDPLIAAVGGLVTLGIAGEIAAKISGDRPGTFHMELYNALNSVSSEDIIKFGKVSLIA